MNIGTCLCGDISWEIGSDVALLVNCHCSICRKVHGSAYATFALTDKRNLRWVSGKENIAEYASSGSGKRPFCPRCGSVVAAVIDDLAFVPAGNLEGPIDRPLDNHIFVASKACWFEITDAAPQFDAFPPAHDAPAIEREERLPETGSATGGSCDCGKVRYEFDGPAMRLSFCHCSRCRKARSAAFSAQAFVPIGNFRWTRGEQRLRHYKVEDSRYFITTFCADCSSPMPRAYEDFGVYLVPASSLDQDPGTRPEAHIHVGSKASWHTITDELPQFAAMPPG